MALSLQVKDTPFIISINKELNESDDKVKFETESKQPSDCRSLEKEWPLETKGKHKRELVQKELAHFISLDSDRWVFKRFECLQVANILRIQNKLVDLEETWKASIRAKPSIGNNQKIADLDLEIKQNLRDYDYYVTALDKQKRFPQPEAQHIKDLKSMTQQVQFDKEDLGEIGSFFCSALCLPRSTSSVPKSTDLEDLMCLGSNPKGIIHKFIDRHVDKIFKHWPRLEKWYGLPVPAQQRTDTIRYDEKSVRRFEQMIMSIVYSFFLVIPIMVLPSIGSTRLKLTCISLFVMLMVVINTIFSRVVDRGSLAALAAYCAILAAFLSSR